MKILFILKERFYFNNINVKSYGLINSSNHLAKYLEDLGYETKVVSVIDANGIDREIHRYKPNMVIIEALWVPGDKLKELMEIKRYKKIQWVVRVHSDIGFLSAETFGLKYINDYIAINKYNLIVAPNNEKFSEYLSNVLNYQLEYLPNVIEETYKHEDGDDSDDNNDDDDEDNDHDDYNDHDDHEDDENRNIEHEHHNHLDVIKIGSFGALRILKNQLFQAMCAMQAADILDKTLHFYITVDVKSDIGVNSVMNNFEELFKNTKHVLIKYPWQENDDFQHLIKKLDLGLQLSYSESFNIVSSDFINNGVPILVSEAIEWMPEKLKTSTTNYDEVTEKIIYLYNHKDSCSIQRKMRRALSSYNRKAKRVWDEFLNKIF